MGRKRVKSLGVDTPPNILAVAEGSGPMTSRRPRPATPSIGFMEEGEPVAGAQARQRLTWATIFHTSLSRAPSMADSRVLANAAQQNPLRVRTAMVEVPGKPPLCHQLSALFTAQPFA